MRIIELECDIEATEDCKLVLEKYKRMNWKRSKKFNIKLDDSGTVVRTFTDGTEVVSLLQTEYDGAFLVKFDLDSIRPLIGDIQKLAKKYYTHDYGQVYINPWANAIWVVCGDGGSFYDDGSKTLFPQPLYDPGDYDCPPFEKFIPEITSTFFGAEHFPPLSLCDCYDEYVMEWVHVASIVDSSNL
jgi:hypothetical protein